MFVNATMSQGVPGFWFRRETDRDRQRARNGELPGLSDPVILGCRATIHCPVGRYGRAEGIRTLRSNRGERRTFLQENIQTP